MPGEPEGTDPFGEAVAAQRARIAERIRTLGPDHPTTLTARGRLGQMLARHGHAREAIEQLEEVLADRVAVLGADHPDCFNTRGNLAEAYLLVDDVEPGLTLLEALVADRTRVLGPEHPDTERTRGNLAVAQARATRDPNAALDVLVAHLDETFDRFGAGDRATLTARGYVAEHHLRFGATPEAIVVVHELAVDRATHLGVDDPDTLRSLRTLGEALEQLGDLDEARRVYDEVARMLEASVGPGHPETLRARALCCFVDVERGDAGDADLAALRAEIEAALEPGHPLLGWFE